jgi:hypothetical membrane protein
VRGWVAVSTIAAPVVLIGGWSLAASRQPPGYHPLRDTISALAARGATDSWIMTSALALLGACYVAASSGLTEIGAVARVLLALGGVATLAVAALRQPNAGHVPAAAVAFVALAVWPAACARPVRRYGVVATAVLLALLLWLGLELRAGNVVGLSERILAAAEAVCPLGIVLFYASAHRKRSTAPSTRQRTPDGE